MLEPQASQGMASDLRRQIDEILRHHEEIDRRLSRSGIRDIPDLLSLHDQLRRALALLSAREVEWTIAEINRAVADLDRLAGALRTLAQLKTTLRPVP